ncbi:hypothetical protein [Shinella sp.]|uniref:hypothetical protein n=1 Tax=Shinella sp. TaxID=1870904 RepID=UPI00258321A0|nr:hypothetical protein [Shinella sp.]MCW5712810.1 hypothetical protein [Shinella sp.]
MTEITDTDWQLIRSDFGDMAYEEPHNHAAMLKVARTMVLKQYSRGELSRHVAAEKLGLRDTADLLVALGDTGLPMPQPPEDEVKEQAATFARLFRENREARAEAKDAADSLAQVDCGESVGMDVALAKAQAILDRVPDGPPDPGDELPE